MNRDPLSGIHSSPAVLRYFNADGFPLLVRLAGKMAFLHIQDANGEWRLFSVDDAEADLESNGWTKLTRDQFERMVSGERPLGTR